MGASAVTVIAGRGTGARRGGAPARRANRNLAATPRIAATPSATARARVHRSTSPRNPNATSAAAAGGSASLGGAGLSQPVDGFVAGAGAAHAAASSGQRCATSSSTNAQNPRSHGSRRPGSWQNA